MGVTTTGRPRRRRAAAAAATCVAIWGLTACGSSDDGDDSSSSEPTTKSAEELEQEKVEALRASAPQGAFEIQTTKQVVHIRGGETQETPVRKLRKEGPNNWTATVGQCTAERCEGRITSDGGAKYTYTWDGSVLQLDRKPWSDPKAPCYDDVTGEKTNIADSAVASSYRVDLEPVRVQPDADGTFADKFTLVWTVKYSYEFFGDCVEAQDSVKSLDLTAEVTAK